MTIDKEKMVFYFKALLCIFLIALWSFWFTNSSKEKIQIKETKEKITPIANTTTENKKPKIDSKIKDSKGSKENINLQNKLAKELPKLVTLTPVPSMSTENLKNEINVPKEMINLNLPEVASATRKALLTKSREILPEEHNLRLRKVVPVEKNKLKPVSINLKENRNNDTGEKIYLDESWLPLESKSKDLIDQDKIAEEIELAGIVNKPNGESTVIIRNKANNYIEILKKGDKYKGLKLLEITKSGIVLVNETLNKTYIKKINMGGI